MQSSKVSKAKRAKTGSTFRKTITEKKITVDKGRNWTDLETESFCRILVDPETNFATTLETKALKQTANKEVFEAIQCEFKISVLEEEFAKENRLYFDIGDDDSFTELDISVPKLRNKYNNLKKQWRARVDRAKNGSGLHVEREALWFQILHPVFSDTNATLDDLTSEALDISFVQDQDDEGDGSEESDSELNLTDNEERPESADLEPIADTPVTDTAGTTSSSGTEKKNGEGSLVVKPHQKRGAARSQTQALGNLASGVNKMADIQSKRLKLQEESEKSRKKERESLLEFRREEAERNRQHELKLAEMYMRILSAPVPAPQPQFAMPSQNQIATWPNAPYFLPNSPPTLNTPPTRRQQDAAEHIMRSAWNPITED